MALGRGPWSGRFLGAFGRVPLAMTEGHGPRPQPSATAHGHGAGPGALAMARGYAPCSRGAGPSAIGFRHGPWPRSNMALGRGPWSRPLSMACGHGPWSRCGVVWGRGAFDRIASLLDSSVGATMTRAYRPQLWKDSQSSSVHAADWCACGCVA